MNVCPECGQTLADGGFCPQDGTPLTSSEGDPLLGAMLGPYRLVHLVGLGGMGRVYKGVNPTIRSRVAIKVLSHDGLARPELVERFFAEARAVNFIRHENIVNVLDLARLPDGRPYIVMEFLDGAPLSQLMALHGRLPLGSLAHLVIEALGGLAAAHAKGVVHRDLKPDNVFVTRQGRAKVLDFGVAKLASAERDGMSPTRAGSLLGTPHYMSPEQALSQAVDARTDLYAVGVILYEGATGRKPFEGDSVFEILRQQVEDEPPPPRRLVPEMPPAYEHVIVRAMAKQAGARWPSAVELARALNEAVEGLPSPAWSPIGDRTRPDSVGPPTPMRTPGAPPAPSVQPGGSRRSKLPAIGGGLALVAAAIVAVIVSRGADGEDAAVAVGAPDHAAPVEVAPTEPAAEAPVTAPDGGPASPETAETPVATAAPPAEVAERPARVAAAADAGPPPSVPPDAGPSPKAAADERPAARHGSAAKPGKPARTPTIASGGRPAALSAWDVSGYLPTALKEARAAFPDAVLARIDADGVFPTGRADLTLDDSFSVLYRFVSPSRGRRPADLPKGVEHKPTCLYYVLAQRGEVSTYPLKGWSCDGHPPIRMPRCTVRQIWRRAAARGAPTNNAVASLSYRATGESEPEWWFDIGNEYQYRFPDDC